MADAPPEVPWVSPSLAQPPLRVLNSLTREKDIFTPAESQVVNWYICGPTVYSSAHMGHARNYVTFDILRRIVEDYFGYNVLVVENITDVDDKIILRARQTYLFEGYTAEERSTAALVADVGAAYEAYGFDERAEELTGKNDKESEAKLNMLNEMRAELDAAIEAASGDNASEEAVAALLEAGDDVLKSWLDDRLGATVSDHSIFAALSLRYEAEFMEDMEALNVRPPHVLTRVSEYIPEIVEYVEKIIADGMAYEVDGSVYFDTQAFIGQGHQYGKLEPWSVGNPDLTAEGEGVLSQLLAMVKRHPNDFALWKKSKDGEPRWESPWGEGRPGWHIECSAMASAVFGDTIDVHAGGEDLRFPHHDNELAQAEAYYGHHQWVNYFLHSGHLRIRGEKMSKSLKNFKTIRQELEKYTARQIRFLFLTHGWDAGIDYSDASMTHALAIERTFKEFFLNVDARIRGADGDASQRWGSAEVALNNKLREKQNQVHAALSDSFDTPAALEALQALVKAVNKYFDASDEPQALLVSGVAKYVSRMLSIFGVAEMDQEYGFVSADGTSGSGGSSEILLPVLDALAGFRDAVRAAAGEADGSAKKKLLSLSDELRDDILPEVGVRLEDRTGMPAIIKLDDRDTLLAEREQRQRIAEEKAAAKAQKAAAKAARDAEKRAKGSVPACMIYKTDDWSEWDETGMPTKDKEGNEVTKKKRKKLQKKWDAQAKLNAKYDIDPLGDDGGQGTSADA